MPKEPLTRPPRLPEEQARRAEQREAAANMIRAHEERQVHRGEDAMPVNPNLSSEQFRLDPVLGYVRD